MFSDRFVDVMFRTLMVRVRVRVRVRLVFEWGF